MVTTKKRLLKKNSIHHKTDIELSVIALPAIILLLIFSYLPMCGIFISFKNINYVDGLLKSPWVGFNNFKFFFTSNDAWIVIRNTLGYNIVFITVGTALSVLFAILLNEVISKMLVKVYQTVFFFPFFFSWIVVAYMVYSFVGPYGILIKTGMIPTNFYTEVGLWPFVLTFINIWKGLGYTSIIFYAGIMGISSEYYEAAAIDGANKLQMIKSITLPLLAPLITIMTLLSIGKIFYSDFGLFFFVPREVGQLFPVTQVIDTYVFRMLKTSGDIGMSSAVGLFQSTMGFILVLLSNHIVKKISPENKMF